MSFHVRTHNGTITVVSKKTGEHRTFRVRTQPADANFMPGKRVVSMLTGPDNRTSYTTFGVVGDYRIALWRKYRGEKFWEWAAAFLWNPGAYSDQVEVKIEGRCRRCNRKLTAPASIDSGIGPVCDV